MMAYFLEKVTVRRKKASHYWPKSKSGSPTLTFTGHQNAINDTTSIKRNLELPLEKISISGCICSVWSWPTGHTDWMMSSPQTQWTSQTLSPGKSASQSHYKERSRALRNRRVWNGPRGPQGITVLVPEVFNFLGPISPRLHFPL